jgi:hypothetical protein
MTVEARRSIPSDRPATDTRGNGGGTGFGGGLQCASCATWTTPSTSESVVWREPRWAGESTVGDGVATSFGRGTRNIRTGEGVLSVVRPSGMRSLSDGARLLCPLLALERAVGTPMLLKRFGLSAGRGGTLELGLGALRASARARSAALSSSSCMESGLSASGKISTASSSRRR